MFTMQSLVIDVCYGKVSGKMNKSVKLYIQLIYENNKVDITSKYFSYVIIKKCLKHFQFILSSFKAFSYLINVLLKRIMLLDLDAYNTNPTKFFNLFSMN